MMIEWIVVRRNSSSFLSEHIFDSRLSTWVDDWRKATRYSSKESATRSASSWYDTKAVQLFTVKSAWHTANLMFSGNNVQDTINWSWGYEAK